MTTSGLSDPTPALMIFDFDGTLADTWDWMANELVAAAGHLGFRKTDRCEVEALRSMPTREAFRRLGVPLWRLPRLAAHIRRRAETAARELRLFEGASEMITTLRDADMTLAVASSNSEATVRRILGEPLAKCIQLYACETPVFGKARKFRRIVRDAGADRGRTIVVGDETRDLEAAEEAGLRGIAVEWGYAATDLLRARAPGRTAGSMAELTTMLLGVCVEDEKVAARAVASPQRQVTEMRGVAVSPAPPSER